MTIEEPERPGEVTPRNKTRALPEHLEVGCWLSDDGVHDPMSEYVELHWLPKLGPTATFAYRRLGMWAQYPGPPIHTPTFGRQLGVSESMSAHAPLPRAVHRLTMFHVARWEGDVLLVRPKLWNCNPAAKREAS